MSMEKEIGEEKSLRWCRSNRGLRRKRAPRKSGIEDVLWKNSETEEKHRQLLDVRKRKAVHDDLKDTKKSCVVVLFEDKDEDIEGSAEKIARMLLVGKQNYDLVESGPLAIGYHSSGRRILHINFKAKKFGAGVETFFSQLIETKKNHVWNHNFNCLGLTDLLPEKADTRGCLYCSSHNIHHPQYKYSFLNGGEHHWNTLSSKINEIQTYLIRRKHKKKADFYRRFKDPGLEYLGMYPPEVTTDRHASAALHRFNGEQGTNFELVKISAPPSMTVTSIGLVMHLNFEAKDTDDPDSAVQTFFAELVESYHFFLVDFCKCLGPSILLPDEADLRGCTYCESCIHHPPGPGYLIGRALGCPVVRKD